MLTFDGETLQPYSLSFPHTVSLALLFFLSLPRSPFFSLSLSICLAHTVTHRSTKSDWQMAKLMRRGNQYSPNRRRLQQKGIIPSVIVVVVLVVCFSVAVAVCVCGCVSVVVVVTVVVRIYLHSFVFIWLYLPLSVASAAADSFALG